MSVATISHSTLKAPCQTGGFSLTEAIERNSAYVLSKVYTLGLNIIRNPVTIFCTTRWVAEMVINKCTEAYLEKNKLQKATLIKTAIKAFDFFGSFAIAWALLALGGIPFTIGHAITILYTNLLYSAFINLLNDSFGFPTMDALVQETENG